VAGTPWRERRGGNAVEGMPWWHFPGFILTLNKGKDGIFKKQRKRLKEREKQRKEGDKRL